MSAFPPVQPLDEWLQRRLASTIEEDLRFEASGFEYGGDLALAVVEVKRRLRGWIGIRLCDTCATFRTRTLHLI
jgi:hypothetical protein